MFRNFFMRLNFVRVKQRKLLSERHKKEEEERKAKLRKEQDELLVKQKSRQEREKTKRQLAETRMLAVHVRRRVPLGTDRNHSRYSRSTQAHKFSISVLKLYN